MFFLLSSFRYSDFNLLEIYVWLEWLLKHWRILWMKSVPLWICSFDEKSLPEPVFPSPVLQREAIRGLKPNKEVCNDLSATLYSQEYVAKIFFFYYCVTNYYKWISVRYYPFIISHSFYEWCVWAQLIWVLSSDVCHRTAVKVLIGQFSHLETWLGKNPIPSLCRLLAECS